MHTQIRAFHRPTTLEEAAGLLRDPEQKAIIVAGATEVGLRIRSSVRALVDLSGLGLDRVLYTDDAVHLGAMVRAARIYRDTAIRAAAGDALCEAAFAIGSETIRNLTSIGGNVIHLTPWSDSPPALQALDARFRVQGNSDRYYSCDEFWAGQPRRLLEPGDILTEVIVPRLAPNTGTAFIKHAKTAVDFALVNAAARVTMAGDQVADIRLSVGAIHTPPLRLANAEAALRGGPLTAERLKAAERAAAAEVSPRRDARGSEDYLRRCAGVVARRCAVQAAERAGGAE